MKITHTERSIPAARRTGVNASNPASAVPFARHIGESPGVPAAGSVTALNALGAVLAVQEVDETAERERAVARGHRLLDELHGLRLAILEGHVPKESLIRLAGLVERARPEVDDPRLAGVLDEIELRAAVEVAKVERERS